MQSNWLVSILWGTLVVNGLMMSAVGRTLCSSALVTIDLPPCLPVRIFKWPGRVLKGSPVQIGLTKFVKPGTRRGERHFVIVVGL